MVDLACGLTCPNVAQWVWKAFAHGGLALDCFLSACFTVSWEQMERGRAGLCQEAFQESTLTPPQQGRADRLSDGKRNIFTSSFPLTALELQLTNNFFLNIQTKARYSLSCIWKLEVSTFKWMNSNRKRIFSDYVIRMKLKQGTVFPVGYLKLEVSTFKWTNSNRKRILSDYAIHMKLKWGTVSPVSESFKSLLLNERIQIEN